MLSLKRSYYTPRRVSSYFSTRGHCSEDYKSYVVYQFNCKEVGCNSSYVGYTTNTLRTRIMQHVVFLRPPGPQYFYVFVAYGTLAFFCPLIFSCFLSMS